MALDREHVIAAIKKLREGGVHAPFYALFSGTLYDMPECDLPPHVVVERDERDVVTVRFNGT
jgi:hypothetical protein